MTGSKRDCHGVRVDTSVMGSRYCLRDQTMQGGGMEIVDYFGLWEHDRSCDPQRRTLEEKQDFWRYYAQVYDRHAGETGGSLAQIAAVTEIVEPGSSVLDVGGGTGRFAIPLAQRGCRVTVLDRSEDMLSVLENSVEEKDVEIDIVHQEWPADLGRQFDTVIAAWSLYWNLDLQASLQAMVRQAKKHLIIIDTTGAPTAWDHALAVARGGRVVASQARHLLFAGGLAQLGIPAEIRLLEEYRVVGETELEREIGVHGGSKVAAMEFLDAHAVRIRVGWRYRRTVGLVHAQGKNVPSRSL